MFAAKSRRTYDIDAVGDLRNLLDASQKFLKQLLHMKTWHTAAERQLSVVVVPRDFARRRPDSASDIAADASRAGQFSIPTAPFHLALPRPGALQFKRQHVLAGRLHD